MFLFVFCYFIFFFFAAGLQINHTCRSESRADTETHGREGGRLGAAEREGVEGGETKTRPDQTHNSFDLK